MGLLNSGKYVRVISGHIWIRCGTVLGGLEYYFGTSRFVLQLHKICTMQWVGSGPIGRRCGSLGFGWLVRVVCGLIWRGLGTVTAVDQSNKLKQQQEPEWNWYQQRNWRRQETNLIARAKTRTLPIFKRKKKNSFFFFPGIFILIYLFIYSFMYWMITCINQKLTVQQDCI